MDQLRSVGATQQSALHDLRQALLARLRKALADNRTATDALIEDAVQESLIRILQRIHQFQGRSRFLTWATTIAIRTALSELRRRAWSDVSIENVVGDDASGAALLKPSDCAPWRAAEQRVLVEKMYELMRTSLTERQRKALVAELRGVSQEAIAEHLGSNRNAVYKLTHDARKRLRHGLEAAGYSARDIHTAFSG